MGNSERKRRPIPIGPEVIEDAIRRQRARGKHSTALTFIRDNSDASCRECIPWPYSRFPTGYGKVGVAGVVMFAHRVMCAVAHGAPPDLSYDAAHTCGNGHLGCVNPKHLRWATRKENISDKLEHGTMVSGCRNYNAHLTPAQVHKIRSTNVSAWGAQARLARAMGVPEAVVNRVVNFQGYRND